MVLVGRRMRRLYAGERLGTSASYACMIDGIWSGGTWVRWGVDHREAPVWLTKVHKLSSRNFEIRPIDGTSNPYLAVAGVLPCGIIGVRDNLELMVKNCDVGHSAAQMSVEEREAAFGITKTLPLDIGEARRCLAADDAIKDLVGVELVESFINVNEVKRRVHFDRTVADSDLTSRCLQR